MKYLENSSEFEDHRCRGNSVFFPQAVIVHLSVTNLTFVDRINLFSNFFYSFI
jgi:hypothetical protein